MCCSPGGRKESDTTEQLNWTDVYLYTPSWFTLLYSRNEWNITKQLCSNKNKIFKKMGRKSPAPSPWGTQHHLQLCDLLPSWTLFIIPWNLQDLYFVLPPSWSAPNTLILEFFDSLTSKTLLSPVPYRHLQLFHSQECFITTGAFQLPQFLPSYQPFPITETPRSPISPLQCFSYSMTHCLNHSFAVQSLQNQSN